MNPLQTMELAKLHQLEVQKACENYQAFKGIKEPKVTGQKLLEWLLTGIQGFTLKLTPKQMHERV